MTEVDQDVTSEMVDTSGLTDLEYWQHEQAKYRRSTLLIEDEVVEKIKADPNVTLAVDALAKAFLDRGFRACKGDDLCATLLRALNEEESRRWRTAT